MGAAVEVFFGIFNGYQFLQVYPGSVQAEPTPLSTVTTPAPAATLSDPAATAAADDKLVTDAAQTLSDSLEAPPQQQPPAPATTPAVAPAQSATATTSPKALTDSEQLAHTKVITPIEDGPKIDLEELVAIEEPKEASTAAPTLSNPVIVSDDNPKPDSSTETSPPAKPVDPNSIAL